MFHELSFRNDNLIHIRKEVYQCQKCLIYESCLYMRFIMAKILMKCMFCASALAFPREEIIAPFTNERKSCRGVLCTLVSFTRALDVVAIY